MKTSKYALPFYCSYGSCITNGTNEYSEIFYRNVYCHFLDKSVIKTILLRHGFEKQNLLRSRTVKIRCLFKQLFFITNTMNLSKKATMTNTKFYQS